MPTPRLFVPEGVEDQRPKDEYKRTLMGFVRDPQPVKEHAVDLVAFKDAEEGSHG